MQLSYWERESFFIRIDVAIIGSGIVGLNAALSLKQREPSLNIIVLERGMLPYGASTRNAGFACFGSPSELLDDLRDHSEEEVFALVEKRWKGLLHLRANLGDKNIGYERLGGYEVFTGSQRELYTECADKIDYLNKRLHHIIGSEIVYKRADDKISDFGFSKVDRLIENTAEAQIDTGEMMKNLAHKVSSLGVKILTGAYIEKIEEQGSAAQVMLSGGMAFKTQKVIVATNAFAKQLLPQLDVVAGRAQVLITDPIPGLKFKGTFHYDRGYYYFRNVGNRVLLGGGRNLDFKAEETTEFGLTEMVQQKLEELLGEVILPGTPYTIDMRWSGFLGLGATKNNIIQQVSPNVYCAVRCGGMGVAVGSLVGEEVAMLVKEGL